jgi:hypothetical protein
MLTLALAAVLPTSHVHKMDLIPLFYSTSAMRDIKAMYCEREEVHAPEPTEALHVCDHKGNSVLNM